MGIPRGWCADVGTPPGRESRRRAGGLRRHAGPAIWTIIDFCTRGTGARRHHSEVHAMSVTLRPRTLLAPIAAALLAAGLFLSAAIGYAADAPTPLLAKGQPVDWWFAFKFNTKSFPHCRGDAKQACIFGGSAQNY